jgi:isopentenyl diphosphate isomerase/L-lactate dehydrogenase-like FMN-dependent dehydrogenase
MNLKDCHNFSDFRKLAKKNLPSPIFHYIDGGADDEITLKRTTNCRRKLEGKRRKKPKGESVTKSR